MHLALKSAMSRIPYTNKVGETLSSIADSAAAYSLRALGGGDPMVARVRRSSDDAEKDFTASDMDSGSVADWVNEDTATTNSTFSNISGTYDTFSGASSSGFTATNTASDGRALSNLTISTPQVGDKFRINYNLTLNSGSGITFSLATSTGSSASSGVNVNASGTGSIELTSTKTDIATLRVNAIGNVDFVVSGISITAIQSSGFVTSWYDQSGNDNNATQSTAASQPKIVDAGVLVANGIKFDGVDDFFNFTNGLNFYNNPCSLFATCGVSNSPLLGNNNNRRVVFDSNEIYFYLTGLAQYFDHNQAPLSGLNQFSVIHNGTSTSPNSSAYLNSIENDPTTNGGSTLANDSTIFIGKNTGVPLFPYDSFISEIIVYDSDQSANRAAIETNINNYYDIY